MTKGNYVLITAAKNEERHIEKTIQSVISQTILPRKWIIASDGSTDRTDEIVERYSAKFDFIKLLRRNPKESRNFASKAYAIRESVVHLNDIEYGFICNLDADISFGPGYYESLLEKFQENPKLGIAGGILYEPLNEKWKPQFISKSWSVSGPIQMFRRRCFEDIDGYIPLRKGGVDAIAEVMARMHGWEVRTFPDIKAKHHRRMGTELRSILNAKFWDGIVDYSHGNHLLFEIAKFISRNRERPYFFGSLLRLSGYCWAFLKRDERDLPDDVIIYLKKEQINRLKSIIKFISR